LIFVPNRTISYHDLTPSRGVAGEEIARQDFGWIELKELTALECLPKDGANYRYFRLHEMQIQTGFYNSPGKRIAVRLRRS
jgi:hypothetical protein